jgi:hypothetical protein
MVRGTILQLRRRCGKPQCHCAEGEPHVNWVLSYSEKGRTRMLVVRPEELPALRNDLGRYRAALADLERQALAGIAQWRRRKA